MNFRKRKFSHCGVQETHSLDSCIRQVYCVTGFPQLENLADTQLIRRVSEQQKYVNIKVRSQSDRLRYANLRRGGDSCPHDSRVKIKSQNLWGIVWYPTVSFLWFLKCGDNLLVGNSASSFCFHNFVSTHGDFTHHTATFSETGTFLNVYFPRQTETPKDICTLPFLSIDSIIFYVTEKVKNIPF